jgi:hypothetical protein
VHYLADAKKVVFVIDVQDAERYDEALQYLNEVVGATMQNAITCDLDIYLHKFDPNLSGKESYDIEQINANLINKIKDIMPPTCNYQIYKTTIFTTFRRTLLMQVVRT